eukprot:m.7735 g.7735  ORF g.7735 m.7735 type:complete len:210 (-) comp4871_c0_seq1:61-690(-)
MPIQFKEGYLHPVVISGPSGAGKSTLLNKLFAEYPDLFGFSVSHTTRAPRPGETNGKQYHFVTVEEMQAAIARGEFIESAVFSKNMYGTSKQAVANVAAENKICILDIDRQGCESVRKSDLDAVFVQVRPPSLDVLEERLKLRKTETEESLKLRLEEARESMLWGEQEGNFDLLVVNDNADDAYAKLRELLQPLIATAQRIQAQNKAES